MNQNQKKWKVFSKQRNKSCCLMELCTTYVPKVSVDLSSENMEKSIFGVMKRLQCIVIGDFSTARDCAKSSTWVDWIGTATTHLVSREEWREDPIRIPIEQY
jgi:hypothetical protein